MSAPERESRSEIYIKCALIAAFLAWIGADAFGQRWYWPALAFMFWCFLVWGYGLDSKRVFRSVGWAMLIAILVRYFLDDYGRPRNF